MCVFAFSEFEYVAHLEASNFNEEQDVKSMLNEN